MKKALVYIACMLLCCSSLNASDTLRLPNMEPLVIWGSIGQSAFDRTLTQESAGIWAGWDLGKSLQRLALAQVNSTGAMGASSTIRCRGLASDHTVVTWHGMSLNSPTLGTADASLIPLNLLGQCRLMYQPNLMQSSAQGLGATIEVAEQDSKALASAQLGFNSLNNSSISFQANLLPRVKTSRQSWHHQWRAGAYLQHWNNDFKYQDPWILSSPWIHQRHNNGKSSGGIMNWSATRGSHRFSAHGWYVQRDTKLPATMGSENPGTAQQSDRQLRGVAEYVYRRQRTWVRAALRSQDFLQSYDDAGVWNIHSRMNAQSHQLALEGTSYFHDVWQAGAQVQATQQVAASNDVQGNRVRLFQYAGAVGLKRLTERSHWHADAKVDVRMNRMYWSGTLTEALFFAWGDWRMETRCNAGRRVRLPDLNELFWNPGGNQALQPEEAWTGYFGQAATRKVGRMSIQLLGGITGSDVQNWIQWTPDSSGLWRAQNVSHVQSMQPECSAHVEYALRDSMFLSLRANGQYTLCHRINPVGEDYQMIYTPRLQWGCSANWRWKRWMINLSTNYQSLRFTDEQNTASLALASQNLYAISLAYHGSLRSADCSWAIGVDNLTNAAYQSVRGYPMPGRVFEISCQINIPSHEDHHP